LTARGTWEAWFQSLAYLIENRDCVVSKDDLIASGWTCRIAVAASRVIRQAHSVFVGSLVYRLIFHHSGAEL
jgi:hypothetical protein